MKLGAEDRKKVIVMAALLAIAIPLVLYNFKDSLWGSNASAAPSVSALPQPKGAGTALVRDSSQDPRLRTDILEASRKIKYETGRNIFRMEALVIPKVDAPVRTMIGPEFWQPPPPPPPPPIPLNYYGFASKPGEHKKVFLQLKGGEEAPVVVAQGDIVARRYKLIQIQTNSVLMEDMLNNNRQSIQLTVK